MRDVVEHYCSKSERENHRLTTHTQLYLEITPSGRAACGDPTSNRGSACSRLATGQPRRHLAATRSRKLRRVRPPLPASSGSTAQQGHTQEDEDNLHLKRKRGIKKTHGRPQSHRTRVEPLKPNTRCTPRRSLCNKKFCKIKSPTVVPWRWPSLGSKFRPCEIRPVREIAGVILSALTDYESFDNCSPPRSRGFHT